jgi:GWxTD domain-containing protein
MTTYKKYQGSKQNYFLFICATLLVLFLSVNSVNAEIGDQSNPVTTEDEQIIIPDTVSVAPDQTEPAYAENSIQTFSLNHALMRYESGNVRLEIYALVDRNLLQLEDFEGGVQARYEATFHILDTDGNVLIGDSWTRKDWSVDAEHREVGKKIPEMVKYIIKPGKYTVGAQIVDLVKQAYTYISYEVEIESFSEGNLAVSDIILASSIGETEDQSSEFYHYGLLVLPNAEKVFGLTNPQVFYYMEIYNLKVNEVARYAVRGEILNEQRTVVKLLDMKDKETTSQHVIEANVFNTATLHTGAYILRVTVIDLDDNSAESSEQSFWVFRPGEEIRYQPIVDPGFNIAELTEDDIEKELLVIKYLMTEKLIRQVEILNDGHAKRSFLASFWKANDPNKETDVNEFRIEYERRLRIANERYGHFQKEGWKTDRGRVIIMNGEPNIIDDHPFEASRGDGYQVWRYDSIEGGVVFVFVDRNNLGNYRQVHSTKRGELTNQDWYNVEMKGMR